MFTKNTPRSVKPCKQQGSILILTLIFCIFVSQLALSAWSSTESRVSIAKQNQFGVRAELSAQSGLDYAVNRLIDNPYWEGTGGQFVQLAPEQSFSVSVSFIEDDALAGTKAVIRSTGRSASGEQTLRMEAVVGTGSSFGDAAGVFLSSEIELTRGKLNGDILIPDVIGAIEDYIVDAEGNSSWQANTDELGSLDVSTTNALKTVRQFTETNHFKGNSDIAVEDSPYRMPAWNLDGYTEPSASRMILSGVTNLDGLSTSQTVVVILDEGETLTINNCNLHGGLVVWAPSNYNLRDGARNVVEVISSNVGTGSDPHIGLMAPAAQVGGSGGGLNFHGLCFWNSIHGLDSAHITGALIVINEIVACDQLNLNGHPQTLANMPDGISFQGEGDGIDFLVAGEDYDKD
jgi:hypothetical protein